MKNAIIVVLVICVIFYVISQQKDTPVVTPPANLPTPPPADLPTPPPVKPPTPPPANLPTPPPAPPAKKAEVYLISGDHGNYATLAAGAAALAKTFDPNGKVATWAQVLAAKAAGAQWCSAGHIAESLGGYPQQGNPYSCIQTNDVIKWNVTADGKINVNVYGIKPLMSEANCTDNQVCVLPFYNGDIMYPMRWSQWDTATSPKAPEVYLISADHGSYATLPGGAAALAKTFDINGKLATWAQLLENQEAGAQWCNAGYLDGGLGGYPQQGNIYSCIQTKGVINYPVSADGKMNVSVFGIKPSMSEANCTDNKVCVLPFYNGDVLRPMKWSRWDK